MTQLTPPALADVGFSDLTRAAIERLPAESAGLWTLHAPVDPGITLLELFAYLLDQRLYWLDQAPDELLRAILLLLGEAPSPAQPAATVLRVDADGGALPRIPPRLRFVLAGSDPDVAFTTSSSLQLLPVRRIGVEAFGADRSEDLARGRPVALLPADGGPGEARLVLHMDADPAPAAGKRTGILLRLADDGAGVPAPQWLAGADEAHVPPPASVRVAYPHGTAVANLPRSEVDDGTGGLRRTGVLRFVVPHGWRPDGPAGPDGLVPYSLLLRTGAATFTAPPRLLEAAANAVAARHVVQLRPDPAELERQAADWLPLPGRVLDLGAAGTLLEQRGSPSVALRERDGRWHRWHPAGDFTFHGPGDRVFVVDREDGVLRFGDGLNGRIPVVADAAPRARVSFRVGGGAGGDVGAGMPWEAPARPDLAAVNVAAAGGGAEPETLDRLRERVAESLARVDRAVTARDHETLAETTPGVAIARARAAVGLHPGHPCDPVPGAVTVFVVPSAPREPADLDDPHFVGAPVPDPGALAAVAARLEAGRLVGSEIFVRAPRYRAVDVAVTVAAEPADAAGLRQALGEDLRVFLDPLIGGDEANGWPFGDPLRPSALLRRARAVAGPGLPIASVAVGVDGAAADEDCRDVALGAYDLPALGRVSLRVAPAAQVEGGLQ